MRNSAQLRNIQILRQIHKNTPFYIAFLLIMKEDFTLNFIFYLASYFFRFIGIFILTGSFIIDPVKIITTKTFADIARYVTSYKLITLFKITNRQYLIISLIIFAIFLVQNLFYFLKILQYKESDTKEEMNSYKLQIFFDHIVFLLFPFIIEFLGFIFYIEFLPTKFIIQRDDEDNILNIIIAVLNAIAIIGINFHNLIHLISINQQGNEGNVPIKYRYNDKKFWVIFLMQNFVLFEAIPLYLEQTALKTFRIIIFILIGILFLGLFFSSLKNFNYPTSINRFVELCSYFSFFSVFCEILLTFLNYDVTSYLTLFFINVGKIIISFYFEYAANMININNLLHVAKEELFKINEEKISDVDIYDVFLYIQYLLKLLKLGVKDTSTQNLLNILFLHQQNCSSQECKCKLLQLIPYGYNYDKNFVINLIERISFLIESSFVQLDYSKNYNLSILLSEHYFHSKHNPIMAYSIIQTVLNTSQNKLTIRQQKLLYELADKYNNGCSKVISEKLSSEQNSLKTISLMQKEKNLTDSYFTLDKINKIKKKMLIYSSKYIDVLRIKENIEESIKIVKDEETGEIKEIKSGYLKTKILGDIIDILKLEKKLFHSLTTNIGELKGRKLPYCIYYKSFLFIDLFMGGKMDENLIPVLYSFTNDRNLYNAQVNPTVYIILRQRYLERFSRENSNHTIIFKYTKGMRITYFSDPLASKLGYVQKELKGENIDVLLPKSISQCHSTCILRHLIINQNRNINEINNFMFDKNLHMIESLFWGICVPGIAKNLIIVINLVMRENTPFFYFLYDKNFEIIGLSLNFFKNYALSLPLVSKFNINLLKILEIPKEYLRKKFVENYDIIKEHKYRLGITADEYITKRVFKDKNISDLKKFGLLEYLNKNYKLNGRNEDVLKQRITKVKKDLEDMYNGKFSKDIKLNALSVTVQKNQVMKSMINAIDKFTDIDLQNSDFKKLLEARKIIKAFEEKDKIFKAEFDIKIYMKMLYDQEIYLIKFREYASNNQGPDPVLVSGDISEKQTMNKNKMDKKKLGGDEKNSIDISAKSFRSSTGERTKTNTSILKREKLLKTINEENRHRYYNSINIIITSLLSVMLVVYIIILVYQNTMIDTSHKIFLSLFYNYYQRDKFMNLLGSVLSNAYNLLNKYDIDIMNNEDYKIMIEKNSEMFEESYHKYYIAYVDLKTYLNEKLTSIYSYKVFTKILGTFEPREYSSTFIQEVEHLAFLAKYSAFNEDKDIESIIEDYENFFNGSFLINDDIKIRSSAIKTLYYLTKNFNQVFYKYFEYLEKECEDKFDTYSNSSKRVYTLIEILGFIIYSSFFGINFIYLYHTSDLIFRNIMNIFIDFTQEGPYSFKNHYDNLIITKKINEYRVVLIDFNMKNLDKYNEKINRQNALNYSINDNMENTIKSGINDSFTDNNINKVDTLNAQKRQSKANVKTNNSQNQTNETKSQNTTLSKSSFIKLNQPTFGNTISKLNEKQNKLKSKASEDKRKDNTNSTSVSGNGNSIMTNDYKKEIVDEGLTSEIILNKMYNDGIIQIKVLNIILLGLYIIIIIYFFVKLFMSLNFCSDIKRIFLDFGSITSRSSSVFYYFDSMKILLIVPEFGDENIFKEMVDTVNKQKLEINEVLKYNIINYKHCQEAFSNLQKSKEEIGDYFINNVCRTNDKCKEVYNSSYNLFIDGYTTTMDMILLHTENIYSDYLKYKTEHLTNEQINNNVLNLDFFKIDLCLNYILSEVQEVLYNSFENDEFSIKDDYHITINILNSCAIAYSAIIGILNMIFVIRLLKNLSDNIKISGTRINNAFCFVKTKYFNING